MQYPKIITKEIPLDQIHPDPKQPRGDLGTEADNNKNRLLLSMKDFGLRSPIAVAKIGENKYSIVNGVRRYRCAQLLGWETIRSEIHPESSIGDIKRIRFDLQNNVRPWKALERSGEIKEIKNSLKLKTNKELAEYLHFPQNLLAVSLSLQKRREEYQDLMDEYELSESYQEEFVGLEPKIRPIKDFTKDNIIRNLLDRVKHMIIKSAKDFYKLGSIFLKAHRNEKEIHNFLKDPDMRVSELVERTIQDGYMKDLENIIKLTSTKISEGYVFSPEIKKILNQFRNLLTKAID